MFIHGDYIRVKVPTELVGTHIWTNGKIDMSIDIVDPTTILVVFCTVDYEKNHICSVPLEREPEKMTYYEGKIENFEKLPRSIIQKMKLLYED